MRRWLGARPLEDDVQRILTWIRAEAGGLTHNILSATHTDTISGAVARGDLMVGESTPLWNRLALGADTYVLRSDGTDAVWADPTLWVPLAPVAQGDMIIADGTPAWSILTLGAAAGYALVTTATTAEWDQTPTWTGDHTWDDGAGDSPSLTLVGGSNDDTAKIFLDDDAVAGNSDLKVQLCAADADSRLMIQASTPANVAYIDASGNAWFNTNVAIGAAVNSAYRLRVEDGTTTFAGADHYGIRNYHKKTAGASTIADDFFGLWNRVDLNQAAANIGNMYGIFGQARMDAGDVGDVGNSKFVYGMRFTCDLNAGKVWGDARALDLYIDQEAAHEVTGNLIGQIIWLDADGTVGGNVFLLRLQGASNVDYGIYQDGATSNYFESDTAIGGTVTPLAQLHVDQSAAGGAQPALLLDQGDISEQCIQFSSDSADRDINLYTIDVTGTPTMTWDESEDDLDWNKNLILSAGDLKLASALGIIHADGVAAGYVLRADGTRYVPADPTTTLPLAPVAQGDLIIADGTPAWSILTLGAAAGYALITTATTAEWDQTPTWTGLHTFNAGWLLAGGTADLDGIADALVLDGDGDTTISAPTDDQIDIEVAGADDFTITANAFNVLSGSTIVMADNAWIGLGGAAGRISFDDQAPDEVNFSDCVVGIRTITPQAVLEVEDGGFGSTVLVKITQDDVDTYGLMIGNDTSSTTDTHGLGLAVRNSGTGYIWAHSTTAEDLMLQPLGFATGDVGIGVADGTALSGRLHIVNVSGSLQAVLTLRQADVDEHFIRFSGTAAAADITRCIVDEGDQASETREGWVKVYIFDDGNQVTDANYYIPFYSLSA